MDEYIRKEDALRIISDVLFETDPDGKEQIAVLKCLHSVRELPAAEVMEVTRCKDCEHSYKDPVGLCCSYGVCKDCLVPEYYSCFHGKKRRNDNDQT